MPVPPPTAAEALEGVRLADGWTVIKKIDHSLTTGANFCIPYEAQHDDGRSAFCKALDIGRVHGTRDPARELQELVTAFNFERDILGKCRQSRLSRVVVAIGHGIADVPGFPGQRVNYILFEMGSFDIRKALDISNSLGIAGRLRALHHTATGIRQLHQIGISHQDVKPSNVVVFNADQSSLRESKLADLGRAYDRQVVGPHDDLDIAGDPAYAPPEQLYGATPADFGLRRLACDVYQLGSLATFIFAGATMNSLLFSQLHPNHNWHNWGGTYAEVLPYVRDAYGRSIRIVHRAISNPVADDVARLIRELCDPDPKLRGHSMNRKRGGRNFDLTRVVSELDLLSIRAQIGASH